MPEAVTEPGAGDGPTDLALLRAHVDGDAEAFGTLFARQIDDSMLGLATGEALAHLRRLEVEGRAVSETRDGVHWYRAA